MVEILGFDEVLFWELSEAIFQRFECAAQDLQALPMHPSLVPVLDSGIWNGTPFLVFPSVALAPSVGPASTPDAVVDVLHTMAVALAHAHAHGIVHGNISLTLLVVQERSEVHLAGVRLRAMLEAQSLEPGAFAWGHVRTVWGTYLGDPSTVAPECLFGAIPDERSDMYALGRVVSQMLSHDIPVRFQYLREAMENVYHPRLLSTSLIGDVRTVLARLTELRPDARYATMRDVVEATATLRGIC